MIRRGACLSLLAAVVAAGAAASAANSGTSDATASAGSEGAGVIVRARSGREATAEALVAKLGGRIVLRLRIIDGFSATLPAGAVAALRRSGSILSVTANRALKAQSSSYDPSTDGYSMANITQLSG